MPSSCARGLNQGFLRTRDSGSGRMLPTAMYLTYPLRGGITVTDSRGLSPHSMGRFLGCGWLSYKLTDSTAEEKPPRRWQYWNESTIVTLRL